MAKNKLTPKQEKFVLHYHEHGNAYKAYCHAYNVGNMKRNTIDRSAKELIDNHKIATRLEKLKDKAQEKVQYRVIDAFNELCDAYEFAKEQGAPSAAIQAIKAKIELFRLTDKQSNIHESPNIKDADKLFPDE